MLGRSIIAAGMALSVAAGAFGGAGPAQAATRVCQPPVVSALASDATEASSKRKAISDWTAKANATGSKNASWRIAASKLLKCAKVDGGKFDCVALARPCSITQAPPPKLKRGKPKEAPIAT